MRLISDVDWAKLFEAVSPVDDVLRTSGVFADMDFATRNLYRTAIEQIARGTTFDEPEIAWPPPRKRPCRPEATAMRTDGDASPVTI
jgi:hypothetical protein